MSATDTVEAPPTKRWPRMRAAAGAFLGQVANAVLPALCPSCREPISEVGGVCAGCWGRLNFISRPYCERLGIPFAYDPGSGVLSMQAISEPPAYNRARAVVRFDEVARKLVHSFKYGDRLDLAPILGRWMAAAGREVVTEADALVPVPLHWRRLWARRFNQSASLAKTVSAATGTELVTTALTRVRPTIQQIGLSRAERAQNVQGAFKVSPAGKAKIAGRRLVLVDDVLTSGATAEACARALLRGGAAQVDVLVFARVVDGARLPI